MPLVNPAAGRTRALDHSGNSNRCAGFEIAADDFGTSIAGPLSPSPIGALLCHFVLETLGDPASVVAELRHVTKRGSVVGTASVEYGGIILGDEKTPGPQRSYDILRRLWRAERIAEPNPGRRLRGLFHEAGFGRVEAFADYTSYGTRDLVTAFAGDRAAECRGPGAPRYGYAPRNCAGRRTHSLGGGIGRMG
jgi:hypothetical protein